MNTVETALHSYRYLLTHKHLEEEKQLACCNAALDELATLRARLEAAEKERDRKIDDYLSEKVCCSGADCACRGVTRIQQLIHEECGAQLAAADGVVKKLELALIVVLPMAKGYASAHPVGNNWKMVEEAGELLVEVAAYAATREQGARETEGRPPKPETTTPTGRKYDSVEAMCEGEGIPQPTLTGPTDGERLDWLEKRGGQLTARSGFDNCYCGQRFFAWESQEDSFTGLTVRAAIDAAMSAQHSTDGGGS